MDHESWTRTRLASSGPLEDAGTPIGAYGNSPEAWLAALPLYAELPLVENEHAALRRCAPGFAELCAELARCDVAETIQHDDLHVGNVYDGDGRLRVLDWGDASVAHPLFSLVVTFHFLVRFTRLPPGDPWFERLRDAYLEPWGAGREETFALAQRVGLVAHAIAWLRRREHLPEERRGELDRLLAEPLREVLHVAAAA